MNDNKPIDGVLFQLREYLFIKNTRDEKNKASEECKLGALREIVYEM